MRESEREWERVGVSGSDRELDREREGESESWS